MTGHLLFNVSCVAVSGRGILIEGQPGSGKSSLALALIDRGATLVGDDGIALERRGGRMWALPPPRITGRLEIRGVGIVSMASTGAPLALAVALDGRGARLGEPGRREVEGVALPSLSFDPSDGMLALRVEWALRLYGLPELG